MQTTSLLPPVRPLPTVEIKFTTSQQDAYDAALLNVEAHNLNASVAESMVEQRVLVADFEKQLCCTVLVNGKPVATATTLLLDECLYVAFVATSAPHRKVCVILIDERLSYNRILTVGIGLGSSSFRYGQFTDSLIEATYILSNG
ncbi:unnamed protein product [Adineta steineri]|uniref:Uncharacterized protein n=1 Tax=Adineta steineri TaxID=433720 RepID=A0A818X1E4_9BILA|nr:unnamed protein product [Adineta steineri]CAF3734037.1 unnamed protein product [Adineta steineri]